ncbi:MAG TPA: hypothetical protein VGL97_18115 [Bryobacteraceae bacterium]|jgi:hypothetical protein
MRASDSGPTIIDTGSTNIPGLRVIMDEAGNRATVELRNGTKRRMKMNKALHEQFLRNLQAAGPLNALPANHCMKSASFGSSLYVELNGVRSPDLSCPAQVDPRTKALKSDATKILRAARNQ